MNLDAARLSALRTMGRVMRIKEQCRQSLGLRLLDELRQDGRYALRSFKRTPGFTAVAIFTLALGIGANTAGFSAGHARVIKPVPLPYPDRLRNISENGPPHRRPGGPVFSGK